MGHMAAAPDFRDLRDTLRDLSLHEADFGVGDAFTSHLGDVKQAIDRLDTTTEPWVATWLSVEHQKAGVLWTAAKMNWSKEQATGPDRTFNAHTRAAIITRFNDWVVAVSHRLDTYQRSARTERDVAEWRTELERFHRDPVRNP